MQVNKQKNNQKNNQRIHIENLTMNKEDISLSKNVQKINDLINKNESLSSFDIKKITKEYYHNLFYVKTTNYGTGAYFNSLPIHIFQLQTSMQDNRVKNSKNRKIMFIQHELRALDLSFSTHDINKNIDLYNEIAKEIYKKKDKKEILNFIKNKIKEDQKLQERFKKEVLNPVEYFLKLKNDEKKLKNVYINVCLRIGRNKEDEIYPNPFFNIGTKKEEIKRNIKISKYNARYKAINNFHQEKKISFLTLTLAHNNKNGTFSKEVKDLITTTKLVKIFIKKLKNLYTNFLKQTNNKEAIKTKLKEFKYFIASQLHTKPRLDGTIPNVWHFHTMFNIDLLKIFDSTNVMICKKGLKPASEFLENDEYYKENKNKYKNQGWERTTDENIIIPNIHKLWADIVQEQLPQLKKLNPRAQNLQIFEEKNKKIKENGVKKEIKETIKYEIKECYLRKTTVKKNIAIIIGEYVTKYEAGISDKEIKKMIKQKQTNKINRNLFQFSRSCKKCEVEKTIRYFPYDLGHPQYQLTSFYRKNILDFNTNHPLYSLSRNSILKQNNKKVCYKESQKEALDFEKNKKQYIIKFKQKKGRLSFSYIKGFYSLNMYKNYLKNPKYIQTLNLLQKMFFIKKLKTKEPLTDFEKEYNIKFTQFNNLISPLEIRLRN